MRKLNYDSEIKTLIMGTNDRTAQKLKDGEYNNLIFLSDNLETLAHYYEGCALAVTIRLHKAQAKEYIRGLDELTDIGETIDSYSWGFANMRCPKDAIWYSFSPTYFYNNVLEVKEIFPDLSEFNEED